MSMRCVQSHYLDWDVQEYTRLIDQDRFRSRAIYSWQKEILKLLTPS